MAREIYDYQIASAKPKFADDVLNVRKSSYDVKLQNEVLLIKRGTGVTTVGINLLSPKEVDGRRLLVKNVGTSADAITLTAPIVTRADGSTYQSMIDGAITKVINTGYAQVEIISDGEHYSIIR